MKSCLDEGTVQCILDGELPSPDLSSAEEHVAACPSCLEAVREAKCEEALISSFFAPQLFGSVPTERLWAGLRRALAGDNRAVRCV